MPEAATYSRPQWGQSRLRKEIRVATPTILSSDACSVCVSAPNVQRRNAHRPILATTNHQPHVLLLSMPPARPPLMESSENVGVASSSPAPAASAADPASRRRSGRVSRAPAKFEPDATTTKRKRGAAGHDDEDGGDEENEVPDLTEDVSDEEDDEDDDGSGAAPRQQRRKKGPQARGGARKPAAKKPKINGTAMSHASSLPSRPKKTTRVAIDVQGGNGLYGSWMR
jgi:hypothetical protein